MPREVPRWGQPHTFALHFGPFRVLGSSMEVGRKMRARFRFPNPGSQSDDFARTSFLPLRLPERWDFLNLETAISHQRTLSSSSRLPLQGRGCDLVFICMHGARSACLLFYLGLEAATGSLLARETDGCFSGKTTTTLCSQDGQGLPKEGRIAPVLGSCFRKEALLSSKSPQHCWMCSGSQNGNCCSFLVFKIHTPHKRKTRP